ncbi:hypothetical protein SAMN05421827_109167 [Pedobacter terrae]|uniref:Uncharacterized protein n=1 Tax=Pedobacter terrae TaxID=405671 RepID=A0A1G7WA72_9SPHI|nr:hypothetical protein SAMN05421827_109167 [Pedobacter terrae]
MNIKLKKIELSYTQQNLRWAENKNACRFADRRLFVNYSPEMEGMG